MQDFKTGKLSVYVKKGTDRLAIKSRIAIASVGTKTVFSWLSIMEASYRLPILFP